MNSGTKLQGSNRHAADLKFLAWARTATVDELRHKVAQLLKQKDFPAWKRVVITRAIGRALDRDE